MNKHDWEVIKASDEYQDGMTALEEARAMTVSKVAEAFLNEWMANPSEANLAAAKTAAMIFFNS